MKPANVQNYLLHGGNDVDFTEVRPIFNKRQTVHKKGKVSFNYGGKPNKLSAKSLLISKDFTLSSK